MSVSQRSLYLSPRSTNYGAAAVATSEPLAVAAGLETLRAGGNAVDAAIATAAVLTITEPCSNGLGSDAFALVWDGAKVHGLNASGRAPAAWTPERFAGKADMPQRGWDTVTVPGAVSGWVALSKRFGRLPFAQLLGPAIRAAAGGYGVGPVTAGSWATQAPNLLSADGWADAFAPTGRAPTPGERFTFPTAAKGLELIAATEGAAFYTGEIAEALVAQSQAAGGAHTMDDMATHTADWVEPISTSAFGVETHEIPPNGQGIAALMALHMMDRLGLSGDPDNPETVHLMIEAVKLSLADLYAHVGDPDAMVYRPADLLDPAYLDSRVALIDPARAQPFQTGLPRKGGTVILTAADDEGMMVSFIQSNFEGFGSGCVVRDYGISLQNRGSAFTLEAGHANEVGPGKRPFHTIIPGFVTQNGAPLMAFGVMGGPIQAQAHAQLVARIVAFGQDVQTAVSAPRFRALGGLKVAMEAAWPAGVIEALSAKGHEVVMEAPGVAFGFGGGQAVLRLPNGLYAAGSDPRKDGYAGVI